MGLERAALRVAAALALAVLATAGGARAGTAHRDPCHSNHTCPSDHHTYVWRGLVCTSYPDERTPVDTTTVAVGGRTYWCRRGAVPAAASAASPAAATISSSRAAAELRRLPVRPAAPMTGYARARFGPAWADVDRNGCDTRDDILRRDLRPVTLTAGSDCQVAAGLLHDPYTGKTIQFTRGRRHLARRPDRPCRRARRRLANRSGALAGCRAPPLRERPARPAGRRRPDQRGEGRRRRVAVAAAEPGVRLPLRRPPGRGEDEVPAVGDERRAKRDRRHPRRLHRRSQGPGRDRIALSPPRPDAPPLYAPADQPS